MAKSKRKQGEGLLRKRADGRWEARIVVDYEDGLPVTKNVTAKTKADCIVKLEKLKEELGTRPKKITKEILFGEWVDYWYQTYRKPSLRQSTQADYENNIYNHIIPHAISKLRLCDLTQSDIQRFCDDLLKNGRKRLINTHGKGLSTSTVRGCYMNCHSALEKAVQEKFLSRNPCDGCTPPKKQKKEMKVLSKGEIERLLIQAKADGYFEIVLLELMTGLRRGELCALQWQDLNLKTGELHISRQVVNKTNGSYISIPKTKASIRTILLPTDLIDIFIAYKMEQEIESDWIFPSPIDNAKPRSPSSFYRIVQRMLKFATCKHIRFHDLRHTFATLALENGMDIKTLSATIGHVSASTTIDIYSHITDTMQHNAAAQIDYAIGGNGTEPPILSEETIYSHDEPPPPQTPVFKPYTGKIRKSGTGCITKINEHLWEGRFTPTIDGKRVSKNIYAHTLEECEEKLAQLIAQIKAERKANRSV